MFRVATKIGDSGASIQIVKNITPQNSTSRFTFRVTTKKRDPDCQKTYTSKQYLERHVLIHHKSRRFHCEYPDCQKFYNSKQSLCKHISKAHTNKRSDTIAVLETYLADIDSQIETVASLILGFDSIECDECFLNKLFCQNASSPPPHDHHKLLPNSEFENFIKC